MYYIAVDIGCIECDESSNVLGIFKTESNAKAVLRIAEEEQKVNWHGQHNFMIFEQEKINE
jgi:hypothetical protein